MRLFISLSFLLPINSAIVDSILGSTFWFSLSANAVFIARDNKSALSSTTSAIVFPFILMSASFSCFLSVCCFALSLIISRSASFSSILMTRFVISFKLASVLLSCVFNVSCFFLYIFRRVARSSFNSSSLAITALFISSSRFKSMTSFAIASSFSSETVWFSKSWYLFVIAIVASSVSCAINSFTFRN